MNKRIKKLAKRAGFVMWDNEPWKPMGGVIDWSSDYDEALEKYTELLLKTCHKLGKKRSRKLTNKLAKGRQQ